MHSDSLPSTLRRLLEKTPSAGRALLVGGCVRDALSGGQVQDWDVEVFGLDVPVVEAWLQAHGRVDWVGKSFGIYKLKLRSGEVVDVGLPRRDSKRGPGHKGFQVEVDLSLSPREAAQRRDFTINALMWDPLTGELLDFFGGQDDWEQKVLRHTSPAFVEDPLRVLRGMQFAARFGLQAAPETLELCRSIRHHFGELPVERVWMEWEKWAHRSAFPSSGLRFLKESGWLEHFPPLAALVGTPQDPEWHPEGDVWIHTLHVCDAMARTALWNAADKASRIAWMFAALCHDFGKPEVTHQAERAGRIRTVSPGHESISGRICQEWLKGLGAPGYVVERVVPLVLNHGIAPSLRPPTDRAVRRLALRLRPETIEALCNLVEADSSGRPPLPVGMPDKARDILELSSRLELTREAPSPILMGRHLIQSGFQPGPAMGAMLDEAFEVQLDGGFSDLEGALAWLRQRMSSQDAAGC